MLCVSALKCGKSDEGFEMRLERQDLDSRLRESRQKPLQMSDSNSRRNDLSVLFCVLDMRVFHKRLKKLPGNESVLAALNEVCGIENAAECGKCRVELIATLGGVAEDALLIFVTKINARALIYFSGIKL